MSSSEQVFRAGSAPRAGARDASGGSASGGSEGPSRTATTVPLRDLPRTNPRDRSGAGGASGSVGRPASGGAQTVTPTSSATAPPGSAAAGTKTSDTKTSGAKTGAAGSGPATEFVPPTGPTGPGGAGAAGAPSSRPAGIPASSAPAVEGGPRTVRLTLARVDPLSTLKLSFLLAVALGIGLVAASVVIWKLFDAIGVFTSLNSTLQEAGGGTSTFDLYDYVGLSRVVSLATVIAVINVIIVMALSAIGAVLYNISAGLVGGLHVTLSDD